jgi:hypothetical protein
VSISGIGGGIPPLPTLFSSYFAGLSMEVKHEMSNGRTETAVI